MDGFIHQARKWTLAAMTTAAFAAVTTSCEGIVYDEEEQCFDVFERTAGYVHFSYDYNIKFADAFHNEVQQVRLFVFDKQGGYLKTLTEPIETIIARGNLMEIKDTDLQPGEYQFLAWADGAEGFSHFNLGKGDRIEDFECTLQRLKDEQGTAYRHTDCGRLFHCLREDVKLGHVATAGMKQLNDRPLYRHEIEQLYGTNFVTKGDSAFFLQADTIQMPLVKDTKTFHIALQQQNGEELNPDVFDFRIIEPESGILAYDNTPKDTETIHFTPWHRAATVIDDQNPAARAGIEQVSGVVADLTTSRLMDDSDVDNRRLIVTNTESGKEIVNLPLIDLLLLVKGKYTHPVTGATLGSQEYLDRQDDYSLIFFLENGSWLGASIYINSWHIVLQSSDL